MVLVSLILQFAFAGYFEEVRNLQCHKEISKMRSQIDSIEPQIVAYLATKPQDEVLAKIDLQEREMMFITLVKPQALTSKVDYATMYEDCAKLHQTYLKSPSKAKLETWTTCVEANYGRAEVPEVYTFLRKCYQKISN